MFFEKIIAERKLVIKKTISFLSAKYAVFIQKREMRGGGIVIEMKDNNILIVAHGDLDGITSAALLAEQLGISVEEVQVTFTQPFLVDKVKIADDMESVYVVDIAINNRNPEMTEQFIAQLGDKLVMWYDHHEGWPMYINNEGRFAIHPTHKACAVYLGRRSGSVRVQDAIVADTREGELSETGTLIANAIKANMADDEIRLTAVKLLMNDKEQLPALQEAAKKYEAIQEETAWLATAYAINGNVAIVDIPGEYFRTYGTEAPVGHDYDLTQLLLAGQKLATFAVAKTINPLTSEEMVTIATQSGINLVKLFGLPSGAPFRVSLPANRLEEVVEKLHSLE